MSLPTTEWKHINQEQPEDGQEVWYWFGVDDTVYQGKYGAGDEHVSNYFYGPSGFLGDDVTWWTPHVRGVIPVHPTDEQKANCKYHPKEREDAP